VVPPGNWHYPQVLSSGQTHKVTGFSFEELLSNMLEFRTRHIDLCGGNQNATIEAVRRDLKAYLCKNYPQNCADARSAPVQGLGISVSNYVRPIDKAANWLAKRAHARVDLVDAGLASRRAQTCVQCVQNVGWQTSCAPCNDNVAVRTQQLKGNQRTQFDQSLKMCRIWGWMNEVAVWMTDQQAVSDQQPPPHCWKITEHAEVTA
jgi:hypothetical protein